MPDPPVIVDPSIEPQLAAATPPPGWRQRWVYSRPEAGRNWLRIASKQDFRRPVGRFEGVIFADVRERAQVATQMVAHALLGIEANALVSFGPGDGRLDLEMVNILGRSGEALTYLPVDLSRRLLLTAARRLAQAATVPAVALTDFEEGSAFLQTILAEYSTPPRVFSLTGNTFGNLDLGERSFIRQLLGLVAEGDRLLISVAVKGSRWTEAQDPHRAPSGYTRPVRDLLLGAKQAELLVRDDVSDVPGADKVIVVDSATSRPLISNCRYDWPALIQWLCTELPVAVDYARCIDLNNVEGIGVAVLRFVK